MTALGDIILLRPVWLVGAPAVAGFAILVLLHRRSLAGWRNIVEPHLLEFLAARGHVQAPRGTGTVSYLAAIAALAALGLAGPATRNHGAPTFRNHEIVFLLIDLSRSMTEGGNLDDAKASASLILAGAGTRPVALALFAGDAYLVSPPTSDPSALETIVSVLGPDTLPVAGSRPDRALTLARRVLIEADARAADIIVLSDGGGLGPEAEHAARALREDGVRVSAVYVSPSGEVYGMPAPDRQSMARIAEAGGGVLIDGTDTAALSDFLLERPGRLGADAEIAALLFEDHGRWFLWPALIPALLLFRRRVAA